MAAPNRRYRWSLLGIVVALVGVELALNWWIEPSGSVEVINEGADPIESLVAVHGEGRETWSRLEPGASARFYFKGSESRPLTLTFRQKGNVLGSYEVPGFNPEYLRRDASKVVIRIRPGEVERYLEEDAPTTPLASLRYHAWRSFEDSVARALPR